MPEIQWQKHKQKQQRQHTQITNAYPLSVCTSDHLLHVIQCLTKKNTEMQVHRTTYDLMANLKRKFET